MQEAKGFPKRPHVVSELLTLREAALRFGLTQFRIYQAAADGRVHPVRPGGRILYPAWELEDLLDSVKPSERSGQLSRREFAA